MLKTQETDLHDLPKAELHVHLDGSLRPATLAELAEARDVPLPSYEPRVLSDHMVASDAHNLEEYLERFVLTLSVMQDAEAVERIAYELAEDHAEENVRYLEARFCPVLCTREGLTSSDALEAALAGLRRAEEAYSLRTAVIVCALRTLDPGVSVEMAELAAAYHGRGVAAFDLAGAEAGNPVHEHLQAFRTAGAAGVPITIHAGEGFGAPSIREAVHDGGASRIGHGTRLYEDGELLGVVRDRGIPLEVCLTSNVQTHVAPSYAEHPARRYFDEGIPVSLCTDNRLMSGVTLTEEYTMAREWLGFSDEELVRVARTGFEAAYQPPEVRAEMVEEFEAEVEGLT